MITNHQEVHGVLSMLKVKKVRGIVLEKHINFEAFKTLFMQKQDDVIDSYLNSDFYTYNNSCIIFYIFIYLYFAIILYLPLT